MSAYDEILSSSNIINILEYYGLKVVKNKCICPFHSDTHPSMMVNTSKGIAKCFACGSGGNVVSFIQKYETEINHNAISTVEAMQKAIDIQHLNIVLSQNNKMPLNRKPSSRWQKKRDKKRPLFNGQGPGTGNHHIGRHDVQQKPFNFC